MSLLTTTRTRKPRRDGEPPRRVLVRAGFFAVVAVLLILLATTLFSGVPTRDYGTLYVSAAQAGNLTLHDAVRVGGARVGQVMATDVGSDGRASIELQLEPGLKLPDDSGVRLRANGLLGARYVELHPGKSDTDFGDGATLRANEDALTFGLPETLDTFDRRTRGALGVVVGELGRGTLARGGSINRAIGDVGREIDHARQLLDTVLEDPAANGDLLPAALSGMQVLDEQRVAISELFAPAARALAPLEDERPAVQDTLERAPSTLAVLRTGLPRTEPLLAAVEHLAESADVTLRDAAPGLRGATALLTEARGPLSRAEPLLADVAVTVPRLLDVTKAIRPVLTPLREGLEAALPTVSVLGAYGCDVQNFATTWRSMTGYGGTGEGPAGPAMAFRLQITPPGPGELFGVADEKSQKDPYAPPCKYKPTVYTNARTPPESRR